MPAPDPGPAEARVAGDGSSRLDGGTTGRRARVGRILREALLVAVAGGAFAFAANEVSPRGLRLAQDYFPGAPRGSLQGASVQPAAPHDGATNSAPASTLDPIAARLQAAGLRLVEHQQVAELFRDPRCALETIVFIDARNDDHYQEGHIPGAYQFDHYRAERYLGAVLPVCQAAEQVVVYCTGGNCEDSEFAAIFLRDAGVAREKLLVYAGGITEWTAKGLPLEVGARKSGQVRNAGK